MALRAIGFHESISYERLEEIFKSDANALFGCSLAGACPRCNLKFGVFFPAKDDPHNPEYLAALNDMIANDCQNGKHQGGPHAFSTIQPREWRHGTHPCLPRIPKLASDEYLLRSP